MVKMSRSGGIISKGSCEGRTDTAIAGRDQVDTQNRARPL